jgi:hypothetical protein
MPFQRGLHHIQYLYIKTIIYSKNYFIFADHLKKRCEGGGREVNASLFFSASITINVPVVYIVRYVVVKYFSHSELA